MIQCQVRLLNLFPFFILERQAVKSSLYNFSELTADREWLYDVIMSDTDTETDISDEDDYVKEMLKTHMKQQKLRENYYKKATVSIDFLLLKSI